MTQRDDRSRRSRPAMTDAHPDRPHPVSHRTPSTGSGDTADLRARVRAARRALGEDGQRRDAAAVADAVTGLAAWVSARSVGLYVAADGELDPAPIGDAARAAGARTFVPVLDGDRLRFAPVDDATTWRPNRYRIPEPTGVSSVDPGELDLVIVPAVAVDRAGHRLGMGGGWYDRTFGPLGTARPVLVGVVHDLAVVDALAPQPWDVPMDVVVTPTRVFGPFSRP